jgi:hypothetical protein
MTLLPHGIVNDKSRMSTIASLVSATKPLKSGWYVGIANSDSVWGWRSISPASSRCKFAPFRD